MTGVKEENSARGKGAATVLTVFQGYIFCKILWWGVGDDRWVKMKNEELREKNEKGERKKREKRP